MTDADAWLIVKRDLYYRPDAAGYTGIRDEAGRYSYDEAQRHVTGPVKNGNPVTIVKLSEAPEFTRACYSDYARDHLLKTRPASLQQARVQAIDDAIQVVHARIAELEAFMENTRGANIMQIEDTIEELTDLASRLEALKASGEPK
jgi:hypothetical protein